VLTWLGRPSASFGSVAASAVWLAERLGKIDPISELPPAPEFDPDNELPIPYYSRVVADQRQNLERKWRIWLTLKKRHEMQERQALKQWQELKEQRAQENRVKLEDLPELPEIPEHQELPVLPEQQEQQEQQEPLEHPQQLEERRPKDQRLENLRLEEQRLEEQRQDIGQREQELRQLLYTFERSLEHEKLLGVQRQLAIKAERQRIVEEWQKLKMNESLQWLEQVIDDTTNRRMWISNKLLKNPMPMPSVGERILRLGHSWSDHLLCLASICDLPYWSRLWIVPEVLLAKKVVICFGDDERTTRDWEMWAKARQNLERIPDIWDIPPIIARSITSIKQSLLFQLDKQRQYRDQGWPLHTLLVTTERSLCEDPRDKIYGLLGLATDIRIEDLDIDYSKPLYEVYKDAMRWYCNCHRGQQEGFPSLVRFSQIVQMSVKGHFLPQDVDRIPSSALLDTVPLRGPPEMFHTTASPMSSVLPLEKILDDHDLTNMRQRDWLYTMTEYLHNPRDKKSKDALENQLKYLDSINTTWTISNSRAAYAIADGDTLELEDRGTNQRPRKRRRTANENTQFFMTACGKFGLASSCIREDDIVCQFKDCDTGVILCRNGSHYILVSKAIFFPRSAGASAELATQAKEPIQQEELMIDVVLDAATLQDIARPFELTNKHKYREPLCVQESSFGWYEFLNHGHDITVDRFKESPISQPSMIMQTRSLWKVLSSKWRIFWTQPLQRLWLLVTLFSYLNNALKGGRSALEMAAFGHLKALLAPLKYLNSLPKRTVTIAPRRKRLALVAMG
jgi:hypothetical protein